MHKEKVIVDEKLVGEMKEVGAHYAYAKARKHPSTGKYVFGSNENIEVFDLAKTSVALEKALAFVRELGTEGKVLLFVGTKNEARRIVRDASQNIEAPGVYLRWMGGTLTNWPEIKKRLETLKEMKTKRESGEYKDKYTKKEQLLLGREIESLEKKFGGIAEMAGIPDAMFIVDSRHDEIAVREADVVGVPVIALANNDCDITSIEYPIPANDSSVKSISYFVNKVAKAYAEGRAVKK